MVLSDPLAVGLRHRAAEVDVRPESQPWRVMTLFAQPRSVGFWGRQMLNKVPEVTLYFWVIKLLCTTVGEPRLTSSPATSTSA